MKKSSLLALLLVAVMALTLVGCGSSSTSKEETAAETTTEAEATEAPAEEAEAEEAEAEEAEAEVADAEEGVPDLGDFTLRFSAHDPETSKIMIATQEYFDQISEVTNGHVTIEGYYSGVLAGVKTVGDMISSQGVDMGWVYTSYFPTQFTLTDVITLPLQGFGDNVIATEVLWDCIEEYPEVMEQWDKEYKILQLYANPAMKIFSNKEIHSVDDIKGLNVRTPSGVITNVVTDWGAAPLSMGTPDIYEAMEKGNIDSFIFEEAGTVTFTIYEVTKYCYDLNLYTGGFGIAVNWDSWNALPEEYQEAIESISGREASIVSAEAFAAAVVDARETMTEAGMTFIEPTEDEIAGWQEACDKEAEVWAADITAGDTGVDGAEYLAFAKAAAASYE